MSTQDSANIGRAGYNSTGKLHSLEFLPAGWLDKFLERCASRGWLWDLGPAKLAKFVWRVNVINGGASKLVPPPP